MGVERFRTFEDAERALRLQPGDPRILKQMRATAAMARLGRVVQPLRGVFKFRTLEEANAHRDAWERANVAAAQARMVRLPAAPPASTLGDGEGDAQGVIDEA